MISHFLSFPFPLVTATLPDREGSEKAPQPPRETLSAKLTSDLVIQDNEKQIIFQRADPEVTESKGQWKLLQEKKIRA